MKASSGSGECPRVSVCVRIFAILKVKQGGVELISWRETCCQIRHVNSSPSGFYPEVAPRPSGWRRLFGFSKRRKRAIAASQTVPTIPTPTVAKNSNAKPAHPRTTKNLLAGVRLRLVGTVFVATAPALLLAYVLGFGEWA